MRMILAPPLTVVCLLLAGGGESHGGETSLATALAAQDPAGQVLFAQQSSPPASSPSDEGLIDPREGGLQVGLGEWAVTMEADTIRPGSITFVIRNKGTRTHGFRIRSMSGRGRDRIQMRTPLIQPGGERSLTIVLAPGRYRVDCYVTDAAGDHGDLGMQTMLTVRADAPLLQKQTPEPSLGVSIERFAFSPEALKVPVGTTVTWTNRDPTAHTITADDGSFDSGQIQPAGTFSKTYDRAGTFAYHCLIHPSMQGKIEVGP